MAGVSAMSVKFRCLHGTCSPPGPDTLGIPEGICTSAPYYHSTGERAKAFLLSSSTAAPILAGFFVARYIFQNIPQELLGFIIAATAGLMIYITVDELIPSGCAGSDHRTIFSLIGGIVLVLLLGCFEF